MADNEDATDEATPKKKSGGIVSLMVWTMLALVSAGGGFITPILLLKTSGDGTAAAGTSPVDTSKPPSLIEFDEVVVNLNESRLNRYLRMRLKVLVNFEDEKLAKEQLEKKKEILKSWLLSFLADKALEDIRGATGQNRIRHEIQNHFNAVLFTDGVERIRGVLFDEFNIQ